jgi:predicted Fe-S protein YdhL (DUF1289 family)
MTVPSPCIKVCTIDEETGFCKGCYRTLTEVSGWQRLSDEKKRAVWRELEKRREQYPDLNRRAY